MIFTEKFIEKLRIPISKLPSGMSFRRYMYKEMSLEEIHELRIPIMKKI